MIGKTSFRLSVIVGAIGILACGGTEADNSGEEARNLTLPPAESLATDLNDQPAEGAEEDGVSPGVEDAPAQPPPAPPPTPREPPVEPAPPPAPPTLSSGTVIELVAGDTLTSRHQEVGALVRAFNINPISDSQGRVVIPAEAVWVGTITAIAASGGEADDGVLTIEYTEVEFDGRVLNINASFVSSEAFVKQRGFGAGDAAKVGAGAVVGGIAGRVLGGNRRGTVVGALAGAAAGVGIMAATRPEDIILPAGYAVSIALQDDLVVEDQ